MEKGLIVHGRRTARRMEVPGDLPHVSKLVGDSCHMHQVLNDCAVSQTTCEISRFEILLFWTLFDYIMAHEMYKFSSLFVLQVMKSWVGPWNEITERLQDTIN